MEKTIEMREARLSHDATLKAIRRTHHEMEETEEAIQDRLQFEAQCKANKRSDRDLHETESMKESRLKIESDYKKMLKMVRIEIRFADLILSKR